MAYFTETELQKLGFRSLGKNIKISDKASIYNPEMIDIGDNSRIDDFCVISGNLKIGRNVHITAHCLVAGGEKGIIFNDFSALAYGVKVFSQSDDYSGIYMTNPTVPSFFTKITKREVSIGRHVIVGANVVILPGSVIMDGVSIGACSLVMGRLKAWNIYQGNPATLKRERSKNLLDLEQKYLEQCGEN
jgi:acetyltransferase-like isoleucine patch superfamily enzyme|tara:strand:+ start:5997 stop:6563 length:567 start_codon:yes stop_codon:yes gene_type:complete